MTKPIAQHWAFNYLGKPWVSGAQGPEAYDCWGLVRAVQRDVFGRDLPLIQINALNHEEIVQTFSGNAEFYRWRLVDTPQTGDCVITKSSPNKPDHVGIWLDIDGGRILQAVYGAGVISISPKATQKMIGQHLEFWRYAG